MPDPPHLLFRFYLEFLFIAKFLAQLNIVYLWDGMIKIDFMADREMCPGVVEKGYCLLERKNHLEIFLTLCISPGSA